MSLKSPKEMHMARFLMGSEEYGLPIDSINDIMRVPDINKLPDTSDYLLGVIKVKGRIIPIIDLKKKLNGTFTHINEDCRIIVVEINYKEVGLLVDRIKQNVNIDSSGLEPVVDDAELPQPYLIGMTWLENNPVKVLNADIILE